MSAWMRLASVGMMALGMAAWAVGQAPQEKISAPTPVPPPPAATAVAATVNGQEIPEIAVYRGLLREHPMNWEAVRKEVLNYLIDNLLVDQYLSQLKIAVDPKEIESRMQQIRDEAVKSKQDFNDMLKRLHLTETELRKELHSALRWDSFVLQQGTDKVLQDYFTKNTAMFDGSQMLARHILVAAKDQAEAANTLETLKKWVEGEAAKGMASLPPGSDKLVQEQARAKALTAAFAAAAEKYSTCPSKKQGGELPWFRRAGDMVEPFARAAFALKPYQMSDIVHTEFGYHLILAIDQKPGRQVKFEDVKPFVLEVYGERLREAILANYKPRSKIVINGSMK